MTCLDIAGERIGNGFLPPCLAKILADRDHLFTQIGGFEGVGLIDHAVRIETDKFGIIEIQRAIGRSYPCPRLRRHRSRILHLRPSRAAVERAKDRANAANQTRGNAEEIDRALVQPLGVMARDHPAPIISAAPCRAAVPCLAQIIAPRNYRAALHWAARRRGVAGDIIDPVGDRIDMDSAMDTLGVAIAIGMGWRCDFLPVEAIVGRAQHALRRATDEQHTAAGHLNRGRLIDDCGIKHAALCHWPSG